MELLTALVGFDTTSAKSNLELIGFVESVLRGHGLAATRVASPDGTKADLFATIGGEGEGGIGLSGHSDCVPVEGQSWTSDPFTLTERGGKLYARGSCDMKGFIACVLAAVPLFKAGEFKEPVHLILSYDEEVGCTGVRPLIARLGKDLPRPRAIIVGEPTSMAVIDAHKRIDAYRTTVHGREAHSSLPTLGVNAISAAASLIGEIDRIGAGLAKTENDPRFEPPFSTISVGTIKGGTAANHRSQDVCLPLAGAEPSLSLPGGRTARPHPLRRGGIAAAHEAGDGGGRDRDREFEFRAGLRGGQRFGGRSACAQAHRRDQDRRRVLHDRGRSVRTCRLSRRDLRARRHRSGACGR